MPPNSKTPLDLEELRTALLAAGTPWTSSTTTMTQLDEEQRVVRLGVPLPTAAELKAREGQPAAMAARAHEVGDGGIGLPTAFDARNVYGANYTTAVKDQASCGSCVAFGSVAALETTAAYTRGQPGLKLDLSEAHLFYTHGPSTGASCGNGWWPDYAMAACRDIGITYEEYFPYTAGNTGGAVLNGDWPNRLARIPGFVDMTGNPAAMKQHIYTYGALTACFVVYQDFFSYRTGVYRHVSGGVAGGHCVALIGWDDSQGCWIAKNSWGAGWGDAGFVRIGYGEGYIEDYPGTHPTVFGATGVMLRAWLNNSRILGLWTSANDLNAWAYAQNMGWLRLTSGSAVSQHSMLIELTAAKGAARPVNLFQDNGTLAENYVL